MYDTVDALSARLCVAGHGRPFTDVHAHIEGNRALVNERLAATTAALGGGPHTALEIAPAVFGGPLNPMTAVWHLTETLCFLTHLERGGLVSREPDGEVERWRLTT